MKNSSVDRSRLLISVLCVLFLSLAGCGGSGSSGGGEPEADRQTDVPVDQPDPGDTGDNGTTPENPDPDPDLDPDPDSGLILPEILFIETDSGRVGPGRILDSTIRIIGRANPFEQVIVTVENVASGAGLANRDGIWDLDFQPVPLTPGTYRIVVESITESGAILKGRAPFVVTYDPFPPNRPSISGISQDSGIAGDGITNIGEQTVQGRAGAGHTVKLFLNGQLVGDTPVDGNGDWAFDLAAAKGSLAQGVYRITASSVDFGLESTLSDPFTLAVDLSPPQPTQWMPRAGSTNVAVSPQLQLQFAEQVSLNGGEATVYRAADGAVLSRFSLDSATVAGNGSSSLTWSLPVALAHATQYYLDISGGAFVDVAGNVSAPVSGPQGWFFTVETPVFPPINIAGLTPAQGFRLTGVAGGLAGQSVSGVGDVNGDGWNEFVVGAPAQNGDRGEVYLIKGSAALSRSSIGLDSLAAADRIRIAGAASGDRLGEAVAGAGDLNGDGFDDLVLAAPGADLGASDGGVLYVIWGRSTLGDMDLANWNSADGFRIVGREPGQRLGDSAAIAMGLPGNGQVLAAGGDYNSDGFADLLVGQPGSDLAGPDAGAAYLILGRAGATRNDADLAALGADGFALYPTAGTGWRLGQSVSFAHDMNNDGLDDIALGATGCDLGAVDGGAVFLVYGRAGSQFPTLDINQLSSVSGVRWISSEPSSYLGSALAAGEFNGDGIADLYMGHPGKDLGAVPNVGAVHVMFGGRTLPFSTDVALRSNANGFTLTGVDENDWAGHGLSSAGDINADGLDDLVVGAFNARYGGVRAGRAWVVLGSDDDALPDWSLTSFLAADGIPLRGNNGGDSLGQSLSSTDHNGDGFSDVILGAPGGDLAAVVWGNDWLGNVVFLAGQGGADNIVGSSAGDVLQGNGGEDAFSAGSGDDRIEALDADFFRVQGGNGEDTLALSGSNVTLDLADLPPEVINSIEVIELGDRNNALTVNRQRVLALSRQTNRVRVTGGASDRFETSATDSWNRVGEVTLSSGTYVHYADGEAEVLVQNSIIQPGVERLLSSQRYYLDTTEAGAGVRNDVSNFPLLLRITDPAILTAVQPGAPDIRFVDDDGITRLPYEIERWDLARNEALVWVLVPKVNGNSNQDFITLLYDDAVDGTVADAQDPATLWNDYTGVWHFADSGRARDSSPFGNAGIDEQGVGRAESFVGRGATFTGNDAYRIPFTSSMSVAGGAFSVETWYTSDTCSTSLLGRYSLSLLRRGDGSSGFWQLSSAQFLASIIPVVGSRVDRASFQYGEGTQDVSLSGGSLFGVFLGNCTEHVVATYDPVVGSQLYINGVLRDTDSRRFNLESGADLILGGHGTRYNLVLDEPRVARRFWNADRIRLSYQNQMQNSSMVVAE